MNTNKPLTLADKIRILHSLKKNARENDIQKARNLECEKKLRLWFKDIIEPKIFLRANEGLWDCRFELITNEDTPIAKILLDNRVLFETICYDEDLTFKVTPDNTTVIISWNIPWEILPNSFS
jgi:hypothetical protein